MGKKSAISAAIALAFGLIAVTNAVAQLHSVPITFTAEQADRGTQVYRGACQNCHGGTLTGGPGGPPLTGDLFRAHWRQQPADALFRYLREKMPPGAAGSLGDAAYADVMAAILKANGASAGKDPLEADVAKLAAMSLAEVLPPARGAGEAKPHPVVLPPDEAASAVIAARAEQLHKLRPVTDEMLRQPEPGEWISWRATYDNHGFSPLDQVNRQTVGSLQLAWSWQFGPSSNQITPLVHDGVMFLGGGSRLQAIDAASGDLLWQYTRPDAAGAVRNIAIYGDLLYYTAGVEMHAVDMHSGQLAWKKALARPSDGLYITTGPTAAKGKVFQGIGGCSAPLIGGCFLVALDARTGEEQWRFHTIAKPGEPGGESWNGAPVDQRFGASVWTPASYDPELDLLFVGTGQTYHVTPLLSGKPGNATGESGLYTNTTLALRPDSGELVWHYQHMPRDVWDLDWAYERTLATIGKLGIGDVLDAATGRYISSFQTVPQNLVSAIDPRTGQKTVSPALTPVANAEATVCPSSFGGRNWPATAYDAKSGVLFVPSNETCMAYKWTPGPIFDIGFHLTRRPESQGMVGRLEALDLATGKSLWVRRERSPHTSSVLATAGGLIFESTRDRWFRASDQRTGEILWQTRLDGAVNGTPITFAVNGEQYVAVTTSGTSPLEMFLAPLSPEIQATPSGTTLWVFRLPKLR